MIDTRRSQFAARSLAKAERMPDNTRSRAIVKQTRETVARATRSEKTTDAGRPR
jgi:hypothetical protein